MYHSVSERKAKKLQATLPPDQVVERIADTFKTLSDPTRVRILYLLSQSELCVHDLARILGASQPATSHHLRLLRMLRLVRTRRVGRATYYALDDEHVVQLFNCSYDHVMHDLPHTTADGTASTGE